MPPKRKAPKKGDKEFRQELLERIAASSDADSIVGEKIPKDGAKGFNDGESRCTVYVDSSFRTGDTKFALISFYNGRGNSIGVRLSVDYPGFPSAIGQVVLFALTEALTIPADELTVERIGVSEDAELYGEDSSAELSKMKGKASVKSVLCKTGATIEPSVTNVLLIPLSGVTNDSWAFQPELDEMVVVPDKHDVQLLGEAILQRAVVALSRDEAKLHPDVKYHGERRKWAD